MCPLQLKARLLLSNGPTIGRGATGRVVIAQQRGTGKFVAIKIINKNGLQDDQLVRIRREYDIMKLIEHPNWVKLIEVVENPEEICIVMEVKLIFQFSP